MNDFTKEELIEIYWKFEYYFDDLGGLAGESPVMLKIQSMIDNYCADGMINNHPMHIDISELETQTR